MKACNKRKVLQLVQFQPRYDDYGLPCPIMLVYIPLHNPTLSILPLESASCLISCKSVWICVVYRLIEQRATSVFGSSVYL